jgi:hypothetical protein
MAREHDRGGHTHQLMQKTKGNVSVQTARSTAFRPQAPGAATAPEPMLAAAGGRRGGCPTPEAPSSSRVCLTSPSQTRRLRIKRKYHDQ